MEENSNMKTNSIYLEVVEGDGSGNNPCRISDSKGYAILLWGSWSNKLNLKKGMKGRLVFIRAENDEVRKTV